MVEKDKKEFFNSLEEHSKIKLKVLTEYIKTCIGKVRLNYCWMKRMVLKIKPITKNLSSNPHSQECSVCEFQNKKLKNLSIRKYECPICHTKHYRDFNASVNIMFEGLKIYMQDLT